MTPLPTPEALAKMVTSVTSTMLGISFQPVSPGGAPAQAWKTAVLPIPGARPLTVGLSCDASSCAALSAAMFSCEPNSVAPDMEDDSLRELANMTAGLLKKSIAPEQLLGLAQVRRGGAPAVAPPSGQSVMLKASQLGLFLWVHEGIQLERSE